ncbi:hypothetical protein SLEP1_g28736 [Rubroshorea leprosula]|uniref:Uncharacterized protein n=1 Tax=Rubroshorea leprosula TaxID=152421 RepID=A0AAV5K431_9ROSI|nr:hypothetical protein SLEP1_g28736 [Rubroshorea leprosula]
MMEPASCSLFRWLFVACRFCGPFGGSFCFMVYVFCFGFLGSAFLFSCLLADPAAYLSFRQICGGACWVLQIWRPSRPSC